MKFPIRILGLGKHLPKQSIGLDEMAQRIGVNATQLKTRIGFNKRHFVSEGHETSTWMGAQAAKEALRVAKTDKSELDLILSASGVPQQPIPSNATLIQNHLGLADQEIPAFDINSTCLSFLTAFHIAANFIANGTYKKILLVSSDITSSGINWQNQESSALFGDGAAAAVLGESHSPQESYLLGYKMKSFGSFHNTCLIEGGLSKLHASKWTEENASSYLFHMDGPKLFKVSIKHLPAIVDQVLDECGIEKKDIAHVIPHQASLSALRLVQRKLGFSDQQFAISIAEYGNVVAASLPLTLKKTGRDDRTKAWRPCSFSWNICWCQHCCNVSQVLD